MKTCARHLKILEKIFFHSTNILRSNFINFQATPLQKKLKKDQSTCIAISIMYNFCCCCHLSYFLIILISIFQVCYQWKLRHSKKRTREYLKFEIKNTLKFKLTPTEVYIDMTLGGKTFVAKPWKILFKNAWPLWQTSIHTDKKQIRLWRINNPCEIAFQSETINTDNW